MSNPRPPEVQVSRRRGLRNGPLTLIVVAMLVGPVLAQRPVSHPLATVDGVPIGEDDVDKVVGSVLWPLEDRLYQVQKQAVEALIKQRLLEREAARRKISLQALIDSEVTAKVKPITDEEIDQVKAKSDTALSRDDIRKTLLKDRIGAELTKFVGTLERKSTVRMLLEAPRAPRTMLEPASAPSKGPANAPVTIVEFTDFHCSHCREAEAVLSQILSLYPVRLVHRDLPLEAVHPHAREAHEAARCADAQGRFWPYRELLFAGEPKSGADLKVSARGAGLDPARTTSASLAAAVAPPSKRTRPSEAAWREDDAHVLRQRAGARRARNLGSVRRGDSQRAAAESANKVRPSCVGSSSPWLSGFRS
jgi:hypothetical protein